MLNIEQNNSEKTTAFLRSGFRVFFMAAGLTAIVSMLLWSIFFHTSLLNSQINTNIWHAHEMIFAYAMAVIVGFLLTAVQNWTGMKTISGKPLLALFLLWAAARFLPFVASEYLLIQALIDTSFLLLSLIAISYPLFKTQQWQHAGIVAKLLLMLLAHALFYLGLLGIIEEGIIWGLYLAFYLIVSLIFMMTRRLIPFFVEKGLGLDYELKNSKFLDISSLILMVLYIPFEVFSNSIISTIIAAFLLIVHSIRLSFWYHHKIWTKPLLWGLYLAYGLLILGFGFKVLAHFIQLPAHLDIHSFGIGIGLITISMMSRVSLGHTGHSVFKPPAQLGIIFALLLLSFVFRVIFPAFDMLYYSQWILIAQMLWIAAFIGFLLTYTPLFFKPRIDGKFG
ncbi:MAG: NnrS family protein [Candidatus Thioglobus sp.]|nr:MAG: NnrS family protein [Candidatus Thioglobus sp.]